MFSEQQEKWLKRVEDLFLRYGIKSLTMDDVARELGISKKNLYLFVDNKDDLVNKMLERHIGEEKAMCRQMFAEAANAIEEMFFVMKANAQQFQQMKANIVYDLQKYHYDAWQRLQEYQRGTLMQRVKRNLERGIREGLYRGDFNLEMVARLHTAQTFQLFDEDWFPKAEFPRDHLFREFILHYLHGILSDEGRRRLKAKLS